MDKDQSMMYELMTPETKERHMAKINQELIEYQAENEKKPEEVRGTLYPLLATEAEKKRLVAAFGPMIHEIDIESRD